jgi:hypothetical protein
MSAKNPNAELPSGTVAGEYVELDVDLFLKAFSTMLMTVKLPHAEGFAAGLGVAIEGLPPVVLEDTPSNRAMDTAARLFAGADQRLSFAWRMVVVMGIAMEEQYRSYRNDTVGLMHIALAITVAKVRGSERTTKDELRESFDKMFRNLLKISSDGKFPTA